MAATVKKLSRDFAKVNVCFIPSPVLRGFDYFLCILSVFTLQNFQLLARTSFLFSRSGCFTHLQHGKLSEMCYKLLIRKIDSLFVIFSA